MIPGDIAAELTAILRGAAAAGELPSQAGAMTAAGTWRRVPAAAGGGAGSYATSLPFALARCSGRSPAELATMLAARLSGAPGVGAASATGGYLTVTVTDRALTSLAMRIAAAGPGCASSGALADTRQPAPPEPDVAAAVSWSQAWRWQTGAVTARLAAAAGAIIIPSAKPDIRPVQAPPPGHSPVTVAIEYAGLDAVRYALTRTAAGRAGAMGRLICVSHDRENPFYAVSLAHAEAAATLRWACDLQLPRGRPNALAAGALDHPRERRLLDALSWLPERVAGAARRRQPHELAAYLEGLAGAWFDCRESCPALPFGGLRAPRDGDSIKARLWLADAARTVFATGLALIGVACPERL